MGVITSITSTAVGLVVALQFDWRILVFMLVLALLSTRSYYKTKKRIFKHEHETEESLVNRRARNLRMVVDFPSNIFLHFSNTFSEMLGLAWEATGDDQVREIVRRVMRLQNDNTLNIIEQVAKLSVLVYVIWESFHGGATQVIPAYLMGQMFYRGINGILHSIADQDNMKRKIALTFQVINDARQEERNDFSKQEPDITSGLIVEFENVSYCYPNEKKQIFKNLNFILDFEKLFALSGKNGGGKTTLMLLIAGKLFPDDCQVLLNGIPTTQIKKGWLSKTFAIYSPKMDATTSL